MKKNLTAFFLLALMISCAEDKRETTSLGTEIIFKTETIEKSLDNCSPEEGECTFISLSFPVAEGNDKQTRKINAAIEDLIARTIDYQDNLEILNPEQIAENFIKNYKETAEDFPEYELPWEATINGKLIYRGPEVISIVFKTDMFTGGAHGYRSTNYLNFDPESANILKPEELFNPGFKNFAERDFRTKHNIPLDENINSTGMFFENNEFHLPENIGITRDHIILHYNAYEIAPYASGNFILSYPRETITKYLRIAKAKPELKV